MTETIKISGISFNPKPTPSNCFLSDTKSYERLLELTVKWANGLATDLEIKECIIRGENLAEYLDL